MVQHRIADAVAHVRLGLDVSCVTVAHSHAIYQPPNTCYERSFEPAFESDVDFPTGTRELDVWS